MHMTWKLKTMVLYSPSPAKTYYGGPPVDMMRELPRTLLHSGGAQGKKLEDRRNSVSLNIKRGTPQLSCNAIRGVEATSRTTWKSRWTAVLRSTEALS